MDNETKQSGIEVDKVDFDENGMPNGLDDDLLDGVTGGIVSANLQSACDPNGGSGA